LIIFIIVFGLVGGTVSENEVAGWVWINVGWWLD